MSTLSNLLVSLFRFCFGGSCLCFLHPLHSVTYRVGLDSAAIRVVAPHGNM